MQKTIPLSIRCLLLFLFLNIFNSAICQQNIFNLPSYIKQPSWYIKTDWSKPNVFVIDSLIDEYKKSETAQEKKEEEDPYITAYIRWRMNNIPFIQPNGLVVYDPAYYEKLFSNQSSEQNRLLNLGNWSVLGPYETFRSGTGEKTNSQCNIFSMATTAANTDLLFAGSESGVLFRSVNKGATWTTVNKETPSTSGITAIGISPTNANLVLYYSGAGLFISQNGGDAFTRLNSYTYGEINRIVFNSSTGRILVASVNGLYYSDNNGSAWTLSSGTSLQGKLWDVCLKPGSPSTVYAIGTQNNSTNLLVFVSTNSGTSFTNTTITNGTSTLSCEGARLAVSAANAEYVYGVTLQTNSGPAIIRSINSGVNWSVRSSSTNTDLVGSNTSVGLGMSNGQGYYDLDIAVSSTNASQVIVGSTTTYKSTDGGSNFSPIGGYFGSFGHKIHPDLQMIQTNGSDTYISTDGGIVTSNDFFTANATVINYGLTASEYWGFGQGWDQDIVVGGRYHNGDAVLYDSYGSGNSLYLGGGEDATGHVFHGKKNTVGFRDIGTYVIPDNVTGSVTSAEMSNTLWPQDDYYGYFSSKLMVHPWYSFIYFVGKDNALWKSTNSGSSYTALKNFGSKVWRFDISRSNPNVFYVCTQSHGIQKTTDGGVTWSVLSLPTGVGYAYYHADIAINPKNSNEVILCMRSASAANKVFQSFNGGMSWTNITGSALNNKEVSYILYHGNNGSMYAITQSVPCEVYFKDNSLSDWTLFTNGLPKHLMVWGGCGLFFRDNKIRMATTAGIWESPLHTPTLPVAQPMADKNTIMCSGDTIFFNDYSILNYSSAAWEWQFPGASYVSAYNTKNPKVVYANPGNYIVKLKVTDGTGLTDSTTISNMVVFTTDKCKPDTVAGKSLIMKGTNTPVSIGKANINSNSFSISCWAKPNGNQISFAQLVSHDPYPGSSYGFGLGFSFSGYTPNLKLCYTDNLVGYGNASSLTAVNNKWNFVVLTYTPTGVFIYLNGKKATVNSSAMPAIDLSQLPFYINKDIHNQGGYYNGEIDEIKIYNYALSEAEVREKMHLIPSSPLSENGLLKYCQFNVYDTASSISYELVNKNRLIIPDSTYINNTGEAPVATGLVKTLSAVNSGGMKDFSGLGLKLFLKNSTSGVVYPNGDLVAFRLRIPPYTKPENRLLKPDSNWFIINNYGTNTTFTMPDSIRFENLSLANATYSPGYFKMFKRTNIDHGNTWGNQLDSSDSYAFVTSNNSGSITFSSGNNLTSFGQLCIAATPLTDYHFIGNGNWSLSTNWLNNTIPPATMNQGAIYINPTSGGQCVLDVPQTINSGANIMVMPNKKFVLPSNLLIQ